MSDHLGSGHAAGWCVYCGERVNQGPACDRHKCLVQLDAAYHEDIASEAVETEERDRGRVA
jgi:hypothetical protein